mgnify:CR=1 FL=1
MNNTTKNTKRLGARSLLKKIFSDAEAHLEELENGRMGFSYGYGDGKSENFIVEADDEHVTIRIADYCWHEVSRWDIEEVTRIQSLVNELNGIARCKVVYHFADDDKMYLTTLLTCPLYQEIPDSFSYLTSQLDDMIQTHEYILNQFGKQDDELQAEETDGYETSSGKKGGKV